MFDFVDETACRICLEHGDYPIFESNENFESLHAKLPQFIQEKIEDIAGYPRNICIECKSTIEGISSFINKFEETCKILQSKILTVKTEVSIDICEDNHDNEPFIYELQIDNIVKVEPKDEKKDPVELLGSLSNLTIKKIKVDYDSEIKDSKNIEIKDAKNAKKGKVRPAILNKAKKVARKPVAGAQKSKPKGKTKAKAKPPTAAVSKEAIRIAQMRLEEEAKGFQAAADTPPVPKLCDLCGETFSAAEYHNHKRRKHMERKFKCTKCPKDYVSEKELNSHILKHNENMRNFVCAKCGKAFFSKKNLREHTRSMHEKDPTKKKKYTMYKCKFCDRSYHYKRGIVIHERSVHTGKKYTMYKCKFCDRSYHHKRGIVIHERSVHTGERPAICSVCDSAFYDEVYLREHMRIHTGDTPYKCPICGRGYTQRGNMKSHMRNHKISELDDETRSKLKPNYFKFMRP